MASGNSLTTQKQLTLDLRIEKEVEIDGSVLSRRGVS